MDSHPDATGSRLPTFLLSAALVALTLLFFAQVRGFEFVNYDDNVYITENPRVREGLSRDNLVWAWVTLEHGAWQPLPVLSHMLDVELFGLEPAGHHLVNAALHAVNVAVLFLLLHSTTGRAWRSSFVAALFAVHPLNVQIVAWVTERATLLCTLFWLLTLAAHVGHRRRPDWRRYLLVMGFSGLALASKPIALGIPATILLFDYWPLRSGPPGSGSRMFRYARELAPLLGLVAACTLLTVEARRLAGALQTVESYPLWVRLGNAVVTYGWCLGKMLWPTRLAVFYPHPVTTLAASEIAFSAILPATMCALVAWKQRSARYLATGWWWYVATLLPAAGIVQVGSQAHADRYAYVPLMGVFVLITWAAADWAEGRTRVWRYALAGIGMVCLVALSYRTRAELRNWRDSVSLFRHATEVVADNAVAHNNLGMALAERNRMVEAVEQFRRAVAIAPWDTDARSNLGNALRALGRPEEAVTEYEKALAERPGDASIHYNLATALADLGRTDAAISRLGEAVRLDPNYSKARFFLGTLLYGERRLEEALIQFQEVARLDLRDERAIAWIRRIEAESRSGR